MASTGTVANKALASPNNPSVRRRSLRSLRNVISRGVPAAGMPGFDLPEPMLDGLAQLALSLNASAADADVPGDAAAGQAYFFGAGQCASCHMIRGRGAAIGPDLSETAHHRTIEELRQSLLDPSAQIAEGYHLVQARLEHGRVIRGFGRNRTRFDIAIQDLTGQIHPVSLDQVSELSEEDGSPMPATPVSGPHLDNLLAYLSNLDSVSPTALPADTPESNTGVTFEQILNPDPANWLTFNGDIRGNRFTALDQINTSNVGDLQLEWTHTIPLWRQFLPDTPYYHENMRYFGLETVPIVVDGLMYVTGPNQVLALDARTGTGIWRYARPRTDGLVSDPSLGTNRGVAILGDKLFFVTDDARLLAIHRTTGSLIWETVMPLEKQRYGGTVAPLIVDDLVVAGVAGGDWGIRGFVAAYHADTGELAWRHWTVPDKGEPGIETWIGPGLQARRRLHLAHRRLRPRHRLPLLGHGESLAQLRRQRARWRQPLHRLLARPRPHDRQAKVVLPIHATRHARLGRQRAQRHRRRRISRPATQAPPPRRSQWFLLRLRPHRWRNCSWPNRSSAKSLGPPALTNTAARSPQPTTASPAPTTPPTG